MTSADPEEQRAASREAWENAADAWGRLAGRVREWGMPVSMAMIKSLALAPGERVLELAAGPGDTGFMAAELIRQPDGAAPASPVDAAQPTTSSPVGGQLAPPVPPGTLISSDGAEAMIDIARKRARESGITNVEFRQLELEWIDLPTATVDAVLCRWGIMLIVDPEAAGREIRRVLVSGGRAALAVWDAADKNPWATIPSSVMVELGHVQPPDPQGPGMFALAGDDRLSGLLEGSGFTDVEVSAVPLERSYLAVDQYVADTLELSPMFRSVYKELTDEEQAEVAARIAIGAQPFTASDGSLSLPGSSLVARAIA
ncbi:MAG TPA: methyltransferase domain-containing protein [Solirubrobacteraceae bacterium]|nr:methyltransferase domain-containing protein [Solirubrobacteraceae bacterium]